MNTVPVQRPGYNEERRIHLYMDDDDYVFTTGYVSWLYIQHSHTYFIIEYAQNGDLSLVCKAEMK